MAIAHSKESFYRETFKHPHRKNILIEGDSWMSHPLLGNISVQLNQYLRGRCNIFSIGEIGHLAIDMMSGYQLQFFQSVLRAQHWSFDAIIMSAGGNDILDHNQADFAMKHLIQNAGGSNYRNYINQPLFDNVLQSVFNAYKTLIATRDQLQPNCPIITHTYDYMFPRNLGVSFAGLISKGPWVYPAMMENGITEQKTQREIIKLMLADFKQGLLTLQRDHQHFYVVDTQGCLADLEQWPLQIPQWDDEIHPDSEGFKKLVYERIGPKVKSLL